MYVCFCLPDFQMTLNGSLMAWWRLWVWNEPNDLAVWVPCGCLCLAERAYSLPEQCREQRYGCVSRRAGSRSVPECHLGSLWARDLLSTWALSSGVEAPGFCELMPKPCAKLNPALTTHILQQGFTGTCKAGMGCCLLLGLLSTVGMSKPLQ